MKKEFFADQLCHFEAPITQMLTLLPDDKLEWSPAANTMPARALVQHLTDAIRSHAASMVSGQWVPQPADVAGGKGKTKQQLLKEVKETFAGARQTLEKLNQHDFETRRVTIDAGKVSLEGTTEEIGVSLALRHMANHVMQLFWYLRQAGVDADSGTLYFGMPPGEFSTRAADMQASA